jgi:beta-lactam-binding protein with PASTA domain
MTDSDSKKGFAGRIRLVVSERSWSRAKRLPILGLWIFGGTALAGVIFVVSFQVAMRVEMRSSEVRIPDLQGFTLEQATSDTEALGLILDVVEKRNDPAIPSGSILQQSPLAGDAVRRGRKIKIVVSLGDRVLEVPDLVGHASRAVAIELRQIGFTPGYEVRIPSAHAAAGVVLSQVPPAGAPAVPNTRVHRLVSNGSVPAAWVMPDLSGLDRRSAESWAQRNGFRVTSRSVSINGRSSGAVLGQSPLAGHRVRTNDIVELTVAR